MKNKKRAKKKKKDSIFMKSIKQLDKRLIHMVMFDALFYLALFVILILAFNSLSWNFEAVKEAIPLLDNVVGDLDSGEMSEDVTEKLTELNVLFFIALARTLLILLVIFIASLMVGIFFKGLIWSKILHKKFDIHFYRRFTLFNLIWIIPWSVLIVVLLFAIRTKIVFWYIAGIILIFLHFTNIIYVLFEKEKKFLRILKDTFILGIEKIHYFAVPYLLVALIFLALVYILRLFTFLPWNLYVILFVLVLLIYLSWVRIYISNVILDKL